MVFARELSEDISKEDRVEFLDLVMAPHLKVTGLQVMVMAVAIITASVGAAEVSNVQKAEVSGRLEQLNKPAVKSIQSPDGDIIDCVPIANQPAFDHPLLRNHVIQMRPSSEPEGDLTLNTGKKPKAMRQLWRRNGECPKNTVPIRRTKEEDLLRSTSLESFGKKNSKIIQQVVSSDLGAALSELAIIKTEEAGDFYGSRSVINVWNPFVQQPDEFSSAQTWVIARSGSNINIIEAGWQVHPNLYGDYNTRFFISWTRDNYQTTGCFDLRCSGFIQTSDDIALGGTIDRISEHGSTQYSFNLLVWKDVPTGNWWLQFDGIIVGYWPSSLFSTLAGRATQVQWGGEVLNQRRYGQSTATNMGSGRFPEEGFQRAALFRNVQIVDASRALVNPPTILTFAPRPNCYDIRVGTTNATWGTYFYFGGPGRNPSCP
ncbi:PREDICTED: uncharacterized protein LOC104817134 [Tarenaya hassleriana]|uniref:uncharacterized protein LOC104817134 n=1 Tax=Tarenaya hassleriana TaxID=28532 RepID=UPI0008FD5045|nr:PREDICTED: uncharacterized protein LOC104817134 [Tarenaya hassleriana]